MYNADVIATRALYVMLAVIIASGGFFAGPPQPARADDPANPFVTITRPAPLPTDPRGSSFSPDGAYLAVAGDKAKVYKRNCGATYSEVAQLGGLYNEKSWDASFSPDGAYLALTLNTSGMCVYKRSGDSFTLLTNPADMPNYGYRYAAWSPDGTYLAFTFSTNERPSGFMVIVKRSGDTLTKLANPDVMPTWQARSPSFSPDGTQLAVGTGESPFILIYSRTGDTFTKIANPADLPPAGGGGVAYSPTGDYLAVVHEVSPFITIYSRSGSTFTKLPDPAGLPPEAGTGVAWSHDATYLAMVSGRTAPVLTMYQRSGSTFTRLASPTSYPTEWSQYWLRFGYDSVSGADFLAVPHEGAGKFLLYSLNLIPPCVTTNAATGETVSTATLNGTLGDKGSATTAATLSFEYGLTAPAYGSTVAGTPASSSTAGQTFTGAISGLSAGTTYHFRAKAVTTTGTGYGADQTFTTTNPLPANLTGLTENLTAAFSPAFAGGTYAYTLAATNAENSVALTATLAGATITYTPGGVVASGTPKALALAVGANVINIAVVKAGSTDTNYTVTVTRAPSHVATVTSTAYTVSAVVGGAGTITNVPFGTAKATFLAALTKGEANQTWNDAGIAATVVIGNTLVVTAQDGTTVVTYTVAAGAAASLTVNQAPASTGTVDVIFTTQPWILVKDAANNPVSGAVVTASLLSGGGSLRTTLTATSGADGLAKFTNLGYNKTDAFQLHFAAGALSVNAAAFGPLAAGTATAVRVESAADGTGTLVLAQDLPAGSTLTVYSITRDQYGNFVANSAATWSLTNKAGLVADGDLVGGGASAVMTGHLMGSGVIHAAISGLTSTDSGVITVTPGAAASLTVNQAPASTGTVDVIFTTQPWILVKDAANNPVNGAVVTASLLSGGGALRTTLTATSGADGLAKFTDLGYNKTDAFQLHFAAGALSVNAAAFGPLPSGVATAVKVETLATGLGAVVPAQDLAFGSALTVYSITRDQFGNFVSNAAADNWTLTGKTGDVLDGDLVPAADIKSAIMTGHGVGTGVIHAAIDALTSTDSGIITVTPSTATDILTFNFLTPAVTGTVNNVLHTVALTVPAGTNVTNLAPTITLSAGATVSPLSGAGQNFTSPVTYTVTAADGTTRQAYIVTVTIEASALIGTGAPTSHGSSAAGTTATTTTTVTVPNIYTHTASVSARTVAPGTPITVTADIINKSTVNGSKKITLYVNGQEETAQGITVNSGGSSQLTFYVTRSEPGDYSVYVDGVPAGSFKVEMFRESDLILIFSVTMLAMAFVVGLIMIWRKRQEYY